MSDEPKNRDTQKDAAESGIGSTALLGWCLNCRCWQGDKEEAKRLYAEYPQSMDLYKGWPNYGACGIEYEWAEIEIVRGDAKVEMEVPANFGCPYFQT